MHTDQQDPEIEPEPDPGAEPPRPLSLFEALSPLQLLALSLALTILYQSLSGLLWTGESGIAVLGLGAAAVLGIVLPFGLLSRRFGFSVRQEFGLRRLSWRQTLGTVVLLGGTLPFAYALVGWNETLYPPPADYEEFYEALRPTSIAGWVAGAISLVVLIPLAEELLFRRIVLGVLQRNMPGAAAVVLVGLLFGAAHFMPWVIVPLSLLGMVLGIMAASTGTLTAPWLGHALFNLFSYVVLAWSGTPDTTRIEAEASQPLSLGLGAVLALVGFQLLRGARSQG
jgi:membrane protease YdiL (CAAX protease family)